MGRAGLVLDPTWTQPTDVGWKVEGPKTDRRRQSVKSVSSSGDAWVDLVNGESRQILQTSPVFAKTHFIYTENHWDHMITIGFGRRT